MLKSIIIGLHDTAANRSAVTVAVDLAQRFDAKVSGVAVVDVPDITHGQPMGIGGSSWKHHRDEALIAQARQHLAEAKEMCREACRAANVPVDIIEREGLPHEEIERLSDRHDLIVMGRHSGPPTPLTSATREALFHLVRDHPRPLLLVPEALPALDTVMVAYDGSFQASRAIHQFVLLGLAHGRRVHVVSVGEEERRAEALAQRIAGLFEAHGIDVRANGLATHGDEIDILLTQLDSLGAGLLVMGAYGTSGLRDFFFGPTTERLLERCEEAAVFVDH